VYISSDLLSKEKTYILKNIQIFIFISISELNQQGIYTPLNTE